MKLMAYFPVQQQGGEEAVGYKFQTAGWMREWEKLGKGLNQQLAKFAEESSSANFFLGEGEIILHTK